MSERRITKAEPSATAKRLIGQLLDHHSLFAQMKAEGELTGNDSEAMQQVTSGYTRLLHNYIASLEQKALPENQKQGSGLFR